jgi:hypothetical protein
MQAKKPMPHWLPVGIDHLKNTGAREIPGKAAQKQFYLLAHIFSIFSSLVK